MDLLDIGLFLFYALLVVALVTVLVFPVVNAMKDPAAMKKTLIGVGVLVAVFVLSFLLAGSEVTLEHRALGISEGSSKLIGAGLTMMYLMFIITLVVWVYSEVSKAFK